MQHLSSTLRSKSVIIIFLIVLLFSGAQSLFAQPCNIAFKVQKQGSGKPMIFIPGLFCSGNVWDDAVAHYSRQYECHIITLPGFAGQPPIQSDSILTVSARQIACYIRENKLEKPVIIGHSLGGWMALELGVLYPDLIGDIVCVSSSPFLPALSMGAGISMEDSRKTGLQIKNGIAGQNAEQIKSSQRYILSTMIRDSARIAEVMAMAVKSDPATQGQVMYELFSNDLRPSMKSIKSKILVLGDWVAYRHYGATRENVYANLEMQFKLANSATIVLSDTAKHFIMFDEPKWFIDQTDNFLQHQ